MAVARDITCREFVERSGELIDRRSSEGRLHQHRLTCEHCERYVSQLSRTLRLAQQLHREDDLGREDSMLDLFGVSTSYSEDPGSPQLEAAVADCRGAQRHIARAFLEERLPDSHQLGILRHLLLGCGTCQESFVGLGLDKDLAPRRVARRSLCVRTGSTTDIDLHETVLRTHLKLRQPTAARLLMESRPASVRSGFVLWAIEWGRERLDSRPIDSAAISSLLLDVAQGLDAEVRARALMFDGHVARVVDSNFKRAETQFLHAGSLLSRKQPSQALLLAKVYRLWGLSCFVQSRHSAAMDLQQAAIELYSKLGEASRIGETLLEMASVKHDSGESREAIRLVYLVSPLVEWTASSRFPIAVTQNLATFYAADERPRTASLALSLSRALAGQEEMSAGIALQIDWAQAQLLIELDQNEEAAELLFKIRRGFLDRGQAGQASFASLDLCVALVNLDCFEAVEPIALQLVAYFSSRTICREEIVALRLFREAALKKSLSATQVSGLITILSRRRAARNSVA